MRVGDRRDQTTLELLDAAVAELLEHGHAALTMDGVSRRAFFSIGAVYDRWASKDALLLGVAVDRLPGLLDEISGPETDLAFRLLVAELLLASGGLPGVREPAREVLESYLAGAGLPGLGDVYGWWAAATLLGEALLCCGGADPPDMGVVVRRTVHRSRALPTDLPATPFIDAPAPDALAAIAMPPTVDLARVDATAHSLVAAAGTLIARDGFTAADTREIAAAAGVTTGALYRRYASKSELLAQVLAARMQPDRYRWSVQLVVAATVLGDDPMALGAYVGRLIGERFWATVSDVHERRVLLGLTVAARSNTAVRAKVMGQITAVQESRLALLGALVDAGLLGGDVDVPAAAWLLQAPPVGGRLLAECGLLPTHPQVVELIAHTAVATLFPALCSPGR